MTSDHSLIQRHETAIDEATAPLTIDHWINGESAEPASDERFETIDPAAAVPITTVASGTAADIDDGVEAASAAADGEWGETTARDRATLISEWMDVCREHVDELARLESLDVGKPLAFARDEVEEALEFFEYYASVAQAGHGEQIPVGTENHVYTREEPYGVAGLILPWNYPLSLAGWKVGAALAAGNTVVAKPSEQAPCTITRLAQLSEDILPDGVFNVVNGFGEDAGAPLTEHSGVDKLSFTGSVPVGQQVMKAAAADITPVTLELGGKSPYVVFPDADLEAAAETAAAGIYYNTGQSCDACSRVLIHEDVEDEFTDLFIEAAEYWQPGDPLVDGTTMGPLTFADQYEKVDDYVEIGQEEGATLLAGGEPPAAEALEEGWFYEPTVFGDVDNDSRLAQEEIFGPVQCLITFESYEEAIELANDVPYGLASGVATQDASLAHRAAADIEAGSVWINEYHGGGVGIPFGGYKKSGIGRECARETLEEYTQTKAINVALDEPEL
ncbi:Betaine-aldehyde dehydrogenase [Natrialba chahannaoensis JCM 10990]|uniref:Betaine-aldehyde dehydrogenase n=1 Tax=Natrialba chahannaoensis JCM 10990 TaxID=1227492 RepID=M0B1R7_9EURY|nr:aldehyde dehydrogenase family protein [Natrialba chahannaoensis]ELZ04725.1 Betaine-aldehyde dehydrogenase [Natrialba chahannaoensis JCM 10990]